MLATVALGDRAPRRCSGRAGASVVTAVLVVGLARWPGRGPPRCPGSRSTRPGCCRSRPAVCWRWCMFLPGFHYATGDKPTPACTSCTRWRSPGATRSGSTTRCWPRRPAGAGGRAGRPLPGHLDLRRRYRDDLAAVLPPVAGAAGDLVHAGGYGALVATTPLLGVLGVMLTAWWLGGSPARWPAGRPRCSEHEHDAGLAGEVSDDRDPLPGPVRRCAARRAAGGADPVAVAGTGGRPAGGIGYLGRPDAILLVLFAVGHAGAAVGAAPVGRRAGWFAVGLASSCRTRSGRRTGRPGRTRRANNVPGPGGHGRTDRGLRGRGAGAAPLLARAVRRFDGLLDRARARLWFGGLVTLVAVGLFALGRVRERLFGADYVSRART